MTTPQFSLDPALCPLCGQKNACAMAADPEAQHCWCFDVEISSQALDRVPAEARGAACVCAACAKRESWGP